MQDIDNLLNSNYFITPDQQKDYGGNSVTSIQLSPLIAGNTGVTNIISADRGMDFAKKPEETYTSINNPYDLSKVADPINVSSDTADSIAQSTTDKKYENKIFTVQSIKDLGKFTPIGYIKNPSLAKEGVKEMKIAKGGWSNSTTDINGNTSTQSSTFSIDASSKIKQYEDQIKKYSLEYGVRPEVVTAMIEKESEGNSGVINQGDQVDGSNSIGLGQVGRYALADMNQEWKTNYTLDAVQKSPDLQIKLIAGYLKNRIKANGNNEELGIKGYNGSGERADNYAKQVLQNSSKYIATTTTTNSSNNSKPIFPMTGDYDITATHLKPYGGGMSGINIGLDYAPKPGNIPQAMAWGDSEVVRVTPLKQNPAGGNLVVLKSQKDGKDIYTYYEHLANINVKTGQKLKAGEKIGFVGNTGTNSSGTHLSLRLSYADDAYVYYNDKTNTSNWIDPAKFF